MLNNGCGSVLSEWSLRTGMSSGFISHVHFSPDDFSIKAHMMPSQDEVENIRVHLIRRYRQAEEPLYDGSSNQQQYPGCWYTRHPSAVKFSTVWKYWSICVRGSDCIEWMADCRHDTGDIGSLRSMYVISPYRRYIND